MSISLFHFITSLSANAAARFLVAKDVCSFGFGTSLGIAKGPRATEVHEQDDAGDERDSTDDGVIKLGQESPVA